MSFIPKHSDYENVDKVTVKSGSYSRTYYGDEAKNIAFKDAQHSGGVVILGISAFALYGIYEYILKPFFKVTEYLGQFFVREIPDGFSLHTIPAFLNIFFIVIMAYACAWIVSFFNKFPNYASRAIVALSVGLLVFARSNPEFFELLGPITSGYDGPQPLVLMLLSYGLLSWIYFICARFLKFRSEDQKKSSNQNVYIGPAELEEKCRKKVAISAFLNRRINRGFFWALLVIAGFDPNFWPHIPFENTFWSGTSFNPEYNSPEDQYYANLDATPSIILQTVASYLFIGFIVITFQVRSALSMFWTVGYAGYAPPHYIYGLAVVGAFCAAVFGFVPYAYIGDKSLILQAVPPIVFIGVSLFRTGRQYFRFLKIVEANRDS